VEHWRWQLIRILLAAISIAVAVASSIAARAACLIVQVCIKVYRVVQIGIWLVPSLRHDVVSMSVAIAVVIAIAIAIAVAIAVAAVGRI
jgi:hypothetical protein